MTDLWNFLGRGKSPDGKQPRASEGVLSWFRGLIGWPGAAAAKDTPSERYLTRERVRSGPQGIVLPWFLPYFDDQQTVGETQAMRLAYRMMLNDVNVKSALFGKILAACGTDLKVSPPDRKDKQQAADAELIRWNLQDALEDGVPGLIWSVLSGGLIDGYSVCEKVWAREKQGEHKGAYYLRAVKPKDTGHDVILQTDDKRNIVGVMGLRYNPGVSYHPSNFLIYQHLPLWGVATGMSDLRSAYRPYWLIDTVWKLRAMALEKRSLPVLVGEYNSAQERPAVEEAMAKIKSQNWLAVPKDVRVTALNIAGSADADFGNAISQLSEDIFLGIAGATLQARQGDVNNARGSSAEHRNTADLFISYLVTRISQLLNDHHRGLVKDILDLNRVVDVYPKATLASIDEKDMQARLEIYKGAWEMGFQLSRSSFMDEMNIMPPDINDPDDSLGGKADQEAQVAAATIESPYGPADDAAADRVLTDETRHHPGEQQQQEMTDPMASPDGAEQMVEGEEYGERPRMPDSMKVSSGGRTGIDAPISNGAGVDRIGRKYAVSGGKRIAISRDKAYAVVNGRRVPLPPFADESQYRSWVAKYVEPLGERDSGRPWRSPISEKWFRHNGERVVQCAEPVSRFAEDAVNLFTRRPERMGESVRRAATSAKGVIRAISDYDPSQASQGSIDRASAHLFGNPLTHDDYHALAGGEGKHKVRPEPTGFTVQGGGPRHDTRLSVHRDGDDLAAHYHWIKTKGEARNSPLSAMIMGRQIAHLKRLGVNRIHATAARDDAEGINGYRIWPRYGFDGPLTPEALEKLPPEHQHNETLQQLYSTPAGRKAWEEHGSSLPVSLDLRHGGDRMLKIIARATRQQGHPALADFAEGVRGFGVRQYNDGMARMAEQPQGFQPGDRVHFDHSPHTGKGGVSGTVRHQIPAAGGEGTTHAVEADNGRWYARRAHDLRRE